MKRTALKVIVGLGLLVMVPTIASAHGGLSINLGLGGGGYYEPAYQPVYVAPPPAVVYETPPPVYYEQPPAYYVPGHYEPAPTAVYEDGYAPRYWDGYRR